MAPQQRAGPGSPAGILNDTVCSRADSGLSWRSSECLDRVAFSHPAILPIHPPARLQKGPADEHLLSEQEQQLQDPTLLQECHQVVILAGPLFIEGVAAIGEQLVATSYVGHLPDPISLSALVLAQAIYNVSGYSVVSGLASALETLCGQAYGAGNQRLLASFLVRAQIVCMLAISPTVLVWGSGWLSQLLPKLGQETAIADPTSGLLQLMVPSLVLSVFSETVMQYLLSQGIALPGMIAACIGLAVSPLFNWAFIYWLGFGLSGAALAAAAVQGSVVVLVISYVIYWDGWQSSGQHPGGGNWKGFRFGEALQGCYSYFAFGLPCLLFVTLEWWVWEILVVMAGWLADAETAVAVMGLSTQVSMLPWMCTYSIGTATATRIAQVLGAGKGTRAARIMRMSCLLALLCSTGLCAAVWFLRDYMVAVLTEDAHIQQELKYVLPVVVAAIICDGQAAALNGLLRACGRQGKGAVINWTAYWVVGLPVSYLLAFNAGWGVYGLRVGLLAASLCQCVVMHYIAACSFDWSREVDRARLLVGGEQHFLDLDEEQAIDEEGEGGVQDSIVTAGSHVDQNAEDESLRQPLL